MKRVLFDFLAFEDRIINGGALYCKTVLVELLKKDVHVFGICENKKNINPEIKEIATKNGIKIFENVKHVGNIVSDYKIDLFFIGITQRYNSYDLTNIPCEIYGVCHDIWDVILKKAGISSAESNINCVKFNRNDYSKLGYLKTLTKLRLKWAIETFLTKDKRNKNKIIKQYGYANFAKLLRKDNFHLITVSEYSANSIGYYFEGIKNEIKVFYCPQIFRDDGGSIHDFKTLQGKKFFLILSCNRFNKNAELFFEAFAAFRKKSSEQFVAVAIGSDIRLDNVYSFKSVTDAELDWLMRNCYSLVYPSLVEGFGLPPLEAMKYGKPVIAGFDTSIPEICGDGVIYFNPLYVEDLYLKLKLLGSKYDEISKRAKKRYEYIAKKQSEDTDRLISYLLDGD